MRSDPMDATERPKTAYSVPPVERAFALRHHVAAGNRCRNISRTSKQLGINRTTLIRLLATLQAERMIEPRARMTASARAPG